MTTAVAQRPRRTQAERSASTRQRLLDATLGCLVELGWAGTSTTEVVRRAGVSRGAQVHHFPTKEDLVLAAVEYLLDLRVAEYTAAFEGTPPHERTVGAAFDLLWSTAKGDTFDAWLEFAVAARTDPVLYVRFAEIERRFHERALDVFTHMFPETAADPALAQVGLNFAFCVLDGMALGRLCGTELARIDEVRDVFKLVTAPFFPLSSSPPDSDQRDSP